MRTSIDDLAPLKKAVELNLANRNKYGNEINRVQVMLDDARELLAQPLADGALENKRILAEIANAETLKRLCPRKIEELTAATQRLANEGRIPGKALCDGICELLVGQQELLANKVRARLAGFIADAELEDAVFGVTGALQLSREIARVHIGCGHVQSSEGSVGFWEEAIAITERVENFGK